ncbi:MAG: Flp family type IVb pilin [Hyphomicrobiales bacterium]
MLQTLKPFVKDENGATAIEYTLIVAAIALAIITSVFAIGTTLDGTFQAVAPSINGPA